MTSPLPPASPPPLDPSPPPPATPTPYSRRVRLVSLLLLVLLIPGFVVLYQSLLNAAPHDLFLMLDPQARLGYGLLAAGIAASLLVSFLLGLEGPRWWKQAVAARQARFKHPVWRSAANLWACLVFILVFTALALLPGEILTAWFTPSGSRAADARLVVFVFDGFLLGASLVALLPMFVVRSINRRR